MSATNKVVTTYSKSLFQNVNNLKLSKRKKDSFTVSNITSMEDRGFSPDVFIIGEELILIRSILISSKELRAFFKNPTYAEKQKLEIILTLFPGLTLIMKSFLKVLTERNHLYLIPEISEEYNDLLLKFKNSTKARLIVATSLEENFGQTLLTSLKKLTNSENIILTAAYNPKLLGGFILEYNSVVIDASVLKEFSLFFNEV